MILPSAPLRKLFYLKFRSGLRRQLARMKKPSGLLSVAVGVSLLGLWGATLFFGQESGVTVARLEGVSGMRLVELALLALMGTTVLGALNHRGLLMPEEEAERLFAAPILRADLVRYRLWVTTMRSLPGTLVLAMFFFRRMPDRVYGFVGVTIACLAIPILGQLFAILAAEGESRLSRLANSTYYRSLTSILMFALFIVLFAGVAGVIPWPDSLQKMGGEFSGLNVLESPALGWLLLPLRPWSRMITATSGSDFALWSGASLLLGVLLIEGTARVRVDFREYSLRTSAEIGKRLARVRSVGGGVSATQVSRSTLGLRVPWVFGRGPFGAVAWSKLVSIVRKARGILLVSLFILGGLVAVGVFGLGGNSQEEILTGAALISVGGTLYLSSSLRFDFRGELERMETIRSWPLGERRLFLAVLAPQILLVSVALMAALLVRASITGHMHVGIVCLVVVQPLVVLSWVAIDNLVFLFSPVRFTPGQDGALQHIGHTMLLMVVRMVFLTVVGGLAAAFGALGWVLSVEVLGASEALSFIPAFFLAGTVLALADWVLVILGGRLLARFDVSRQIV